MSAPQIPAVTLDSCAREPIHIPGRVQSFGALVAITPDWMIAHRSANLGAFLGLDTDPQPGTRVVDALGEPFIAAVQRRLKDASGPESVERLFGSRLVEGGDRFDVAIHRSGRLTVIELERHDALEHERHSGMLRPMMARLEQCGSVTTLCEAAARQLKHLLGFDRVMVYRFHPDDSGEVLAEAREPQLESFLGLRYPASDIPPQARALYLRNLLRIIGDVDDPTVPVEPATGPGGQPLDLSLSTLRAVSPIHIEYLKNMGVGASMSVSIILRGKLWGLFACHHYGPRVVDYSRRSAAEMFAQLFGLLLDQRIGDAMRRSADRAQVLHDRLMTRVAESSGLLENIDTLLPLIAEVIPHDGASIYIDGEYIAHGSAPDAAQFGALVSFFNTIAAGSVYATDSLQRQIDAAAAFSDRAAGALVIPVSRRPRDYVVLWRRELVHAVRWAGNPEKPIEYGPNGARLTPRKSFEAWQQVVKGTSVGWDEQEVRAAESLRVTLLEVILRITDSAVQERARAQEQQELLIAELNHRVRNILNLIRGLVSQSRHEAATVEDFTALVAGRIHALALAHDNITRENWAASSLAELIRSEAQAYLSGKSDRLEIHGEDVLITPEAYAVLALVIHEMMTNSAKYGALCDHHGRVDVTLSRGDTKQLLIAWRESGGPPVRAPKRRGFGTTIIERSIPYELKGTAEVRYRVSGVEADFCVPERFVTATAETCAARQRAATAPAEKPAISSDRALPERVLLLEDNMIIAIDAEEALRELGVAEVQLASSNDGALLSMRDAPPQFALLDFNLGAETSEPTARALIERGIPFVFTTGYGELDRFNEAFADVTVVQKPYSRDDLARVMAERAG